MVYGKIQSLLLIFRYFYQYLKLIKKFVFALYSTSNKKCATFAASYMVDVAQLVRASDCGSEGRGFEPLLPPEEVERCPVFVSCKGKTHGAFFFVFDTFVTRFVYIIEIQTFVGSKRDPTEKISIAQNTCRLLEKSLHQKAILVHLRYNLQTELFHSLF